MKALLLIPFLFILNGAHKYYVSMTDIAWNQEVATLEISSKFFIDDFERAINQSGTSHHISKEMDQELLPLIQGIYSRGIQIENDKEFCDIEFLGYEIEEDVIWCYGEVQNIHHIDRLTITSEWMTELFSKQINIFNLIAENEIKTIHLSKKSNSGTFE